MDVGGIRRARQGGQTIPAKAGTPPKAAAARPRTDQIILSHQAASRLMEAQAKRTKQAERNWWQLDLVQRDEGKGSPQDALNQDMKKQRTCQRIAARIMAGDKVPPEDLKYLMEHDLQGYQLAMASRQPKADPKEWDSALEKEEAQGAKSVSGSSEAPPETSSGEGGASGAEGGEM